MTYLKLIRWNNVLMVLITQILTFACIILPFRDFAIEFYISFLTLLAASFFIVSSGYIINDFYDVEIDKHNKPEKMVVGKSVSHQATFVIYLLHISLGAVLGLITAYLSKSIVFGILFIMAIAILWLYSYQLKKTLLWGNIVVAIMAAAPVYSVLMLLFFTEWQEVNLFKWIEKNQVIVSFIFAYSFFAVTTHFIREVVKDIQDMDGDKAFRCMTVPIKYGKRKSSVIVQWLSIFLLLFLVAAMLGLFYNHFYLMGSFSVILLGFMLLILLKLQKAKTSSDFGKSGTFIKWFMLLGILSMALIPLS